MGRLPAAAVVSGLLLAACGGGHHQQVASTPAAPRSIPVRPGDERVIRGWNMAENAGDYQRAGRYFARGAFVIQSYILQLQDQRDAVEWNSSLPCRADITFIQGEQATTLVSFTLRQGPTGKCKGGGTAQVRFTIRAGRIQQWRQLPEQTGPSV
ncbi:MAG: hypothetical protein ACXVRH_13100 [Thermoleophilaceae bacterium]